MDQQFGTADFYSSALQTQGHDATETILNCKPLQIRWARENRVHLGKRLGRRFVNHISVPWIKPNWLYPVLAAQIAAFEPDVVLNHHLALDQSWLRTIKHHMRLLVAQHAAMPLESSRDWKVYDLALSSFPPTVEWFKEHGVQAKLFRLGLQPSVVVDRPDDERNISVSFVGSFAPVHTSRTEFLKHLARNVPLEHWGVPPARGFNDESLQRSYRGTAWGAAMFNILGNSRIVVNHHGNVPPFANNMRLYEATGSGALLLTDWKPDLSDIFDVGTEVVAYRDAQEAVELVRYYLEHETERRAIARAGQARTMQCHTYARRMEELVSIIEEHLLK
jgi:spore maturation protein CgeB